MTTEEIENRLQKIRDIAAGDDEEAHILEKSLLTDFVRYVATLDDLPSLSAKARLILTSGQIEFQRWFA